VHDLAGAQTAAERGADYLVLGPVFPTPSHQGAPALGAERYREIAGAVPVPVLAIGGLDRERAADLGGAGFAAVRAFGGEDGRPGSQP
ncbi:MAG: thiamine phosphate synthase, partial [Candidatus Dormibacteraceae bacterium]